LLVENSNFGSSALLGWHPLICGAVKSVVGCVLERLFGRVHHKVAFAVLVGQLKRIEWNRDILFTDAKETADT
jgi:hypothetical protein